MAATLIQKLKVESANPISVLEKLENSIILEKVDNTTAIYSTKKFVEDFMKTCNTYTTTVAPDYKEITTTHVDEKLNNNFKTTFRIHEGCEYFELIKIKSTKPRTKIIYSRDFMKEPTQTCVLLKNTERKIPLKSELTKRKAGR